MRRQRGIALVLVLVVTGILGLLMLQFGLTAREHVARAQLLADRAEAEFGAQSREAAMVYSLLTQPWVERQASEADPDHVYSAVWNFHGQPFTVDGVTYTIQDTAGLLPVPQSQVGPAAFLALLRELEVEPMRAERLVEQLDALRGVAPELAPLGRGARPEVARPESEPDPETSADATSRAARGFPIQSLAELRHLPDMDAKLMARLQRMVTLVPTPGFNPLTAPAEVLAAKVGGSATEGLLELRRQGQLNQATLYDAAGLGEGEATTVYPGPGLWIELSYSHAGVVVRRETTFLLRPYAIDPVGIWSRRSAGRPDA